MILMLGPLKKGGVSTVEVSRTATTNTNYVVVFVPSEPKYVYVHINDSFDATGTTCYLNPNPRTWPVPYFRNAQFKVLELAKAAALFPQRLNC